MFPLHCSISYEIKGEGMAENNIHLVAHSPTAADSATCLQLSPAPLAPFNAPKMLGQSGLIAPAAAAAYRARMVGM